MLFLFLIFPFLEPLLFKEYSNIDLVFSIYKIISFIIIIYLYIKQGKINKIDVTIFMSKIIIILSTLYNEGDIIKTLGPTISVLSFVMLTEVALRKINIIFIDIIVKIYCVYMWLNFITLILYPEGVIKPDNWTPVYFLGIDNRFIFTLLPFVVFSLIFSLIKYNKIRCYDYFNIIIILNMFIFLWSVGAAIGIILLSLYIFFVYPTKLNKKINYSFLICFVLILNLLIVYFQIQNYFSYLFVDILKKDLTISGRTILWQKIIEIIKDNFIFGRGSIYNSELYQIFDVPLTHPHNLFLSISYQGGIISFLLYLYILKLVGGKLNKYRNEKIYSILTVAIFIILLLSVVDTVDDGIIYVVYVIAYNIEIILKYRQGEKN